MCSKPKLVLARELRKKGMFYRAKNPTELSAVFANRFTAPPGTWNELLKPVIRLKVDIARVDLDEPVLVQVIQFIRDEDGAVVSTEKGYVSTVTLAADPERYQQVNAKSPKETTESPEVRAAA